MESSTPGTGAAIASKTLRILVVDDHSDSATSVQLLIRRKGHEVEVAFDGDEALRVGNVLKPRLVLIDLSLPGKDGVEVARAMRTTEWGRTAILVATTGWGSDSDQQRALEAGFNQFLTKPVEPETLYRLLESLAQAESG